MTVARDRRAAGAMLLSALLAACGSVTPTPAPTPGPTATPTAAPPVFFPARDTPYDHAGTALQTYWAPYTVGTIPGVAALAGQPPAPRVVNLTTTVPDDVAQTWGGAVMHTAMWERWAIKASQPGLLARLGRDATTSEGFLDGGAIVSRPDCDLFPVQLTLVANAPGGGTFDQYSMVATYKGLNGNTCDTTSADPGTPAQVVRSYTVDSEIMAGWVHSDPVLGDVWITDSRTSCSTDCPAPPAAGRAPVTSPPALPATDTAMTDATPALQAAWSPYEVTVIPGRSAVAGLPPLPPLDNQTGGVVSADMAVTWERGLFRDLAWQRWLWRLTQIPFLSHLIAAGAADGFLRQYGSQGANADLPACAAYPGTVRLATNSDGDRHGTSEAAISQYHFDLTYAANCTVTVAMPDGSHKTATPVHSETLYGDARSDPLLGTIWYPKELASHDS